MRRLRIELERHERAAPYKHVMVVRMPFTAITGVKWEHSIRPPGLFGMPYHAAAARDRPLSHTDIHFLAAHLLHAEDQPLTVLGAKVYDEAGQSARDVDIVMCNTPTQAITGVEVKDEKTPLDITVVEQLCAKMLDMPDLSERAIVSSSGFTKAALRKAKAKGVHALRLVRGEIPVFAGVDFSALDTIEEVQYRWTAIPSIVWEVDGLNAEGMAKVPLDATVTIRGPQGEYSAQLGAVQNRLMSDAAKSLQPFGQENSLTAHFENAGVLHVGNERFALRNALVTGTVTREEHRVSASRIYLSDSSNAPLAAAVVFESDDQLMSLATSRKNEFISRLYVGPEYRAPQPISRTL